MAKFVETKPLLIASGLPAEVARLREENSHLRDEYAAEIGRTRAELSRLRGELSACKIANEHLLATIRPLLDAGVAVAELKRAIDAALKDQQP